MAADSVVKLHSFAAVFPVSDVNRSLRFYVEQLGFREYFRMPDLSYAITDRDAISIHLMLARNDTAGIGKSCVYIFADDIDALHKQFKDRGCAIEVPPTDFQYGMREMSVRDPDGNHLTFGREIKRPE